MWLIWLVFCDCGFHSVCPLMDKDKRLMEASWWEAPWKKSYDQPRQQSKSRDITLSTKVHLVKAMAFPVVTYGYESWTIRKAWALKNWRFWTVVLEKTLESLLDSKEVNPVSPEGNQPWIFIERTDIEAEAPIFGHLMRGDDSLGKTLMLEKILETPLNSKEIKPINPEGNQPWIFIGRTDAEAPILWSPDVKNWLILKRPWCWERLKAGGEGDNRGWDGWMASLTRWTWVWISSRSWWRTERPGLLHSIGL